MALRRTLGLIVAALIVALPAISQVVYPPYLVGMAPVASTWPDQEIRCFNLGADCQCSEPLDATSVDSSSPHNPNASVAKPCTGTSNPDDTIGFSGSVPLFISTAAMTGSPYNFPAFPTGTTNVANILADDVAGQLAVKDTQGLTVHDQTYCRRHYFVLHETMEIDYSGGDRIKMSRVSKGSPELHHESEFQFGSPGTSAGFRSYETTPNDWGGVFDNSSWVTGLSLADMRDKWWRMENCWDHDATGTSDKLHHRVQLKDLSTGTIYENSPVMISPSAIASGASMGSSGNNWIIDGFRQTNGSRLAAGMWSGFAGAMTARVDYDSSFWIGPAVEIEGITSDP